MLSVVFQQLEQITAPVGLYSVPYKRKYACIFLQVAAASFASPLVGGSVQVRFSPFPDFLKEGALAWLPR